MRTITLLLFFVLSINILKAEKHALLVGVGDYSEWDKWPDLASVNDINRIKEVLKIHNFSTQNITILLNKKATKDGIIKAFSNLNNKLKAGDIVFLHFSGHGQQIPDKDGDELDQLDEAFVPYDSPKHFQAGKYEGEQLLIDDEIHMLSTRLRKKIGPTGQLILTLDSCHSGTGNRGQGIARGTDIIMAPEGFEPTVIITEPFEQMDKELTKGLAPMGSFFGSSAEELNYQALDEQGEPIGSLSLAVAIELAKLIEPITFQDFFLKIQQRIKGSQSQNPQWDGPTAELLFGKEHYKTLQTGCSATFESKKLLKGQTGTIRGVHRGSTVEVFNKTRGSIGFGKIKEAGMTESLIELEAPLSYIPDEEISIEVKTKVELPIKSALVIQLSENSKWKPLGQTLRNTYGIQEVSKNGDVYLLEKETDIIQLVTKEGHILYEEKDQEIEEVAYELKKHIHAYGQAKFLRSYQQANSIYDFSISLLPGEQTVDKDKLPPALGNKLQIGTEIYIAIKNEGNKAAYFSLIDIQPDNQLNVLIPFEEDPDLFYLQPGEIYVTDYPIEIGEPVGEETLKLICTNLPLDLTDLIEAEGQVDRTLQELHPFEQALINSFQKEEFRGQTVNRPSFEEIGVTTLFFSIEE